MNYDLLVVNKRFYAKNVLLKTTFLIYYKDVLLLPYKAVRYAKLLQKKKLIRL